MTYRVRIVAEGVTSKGKPLAVDSIIEGPHAVIHCLRGFRNSDPIAEPADAVTTEKVAELSARQTVQQATQRKHIAKAVKALAVKLPTDDAGEFVRKTDGNVPKASQVEQALIDNAAAYGITPTSVEPQPTTPVITPDNVTVEPPVQSPQPAVPAVVEAFSVAEQPAEASEPQKLIEYQPTTPVITPDNVTVDQPVQSPQPAADPVETTVADVVSNPVVDFVDIPSL